MAEQITVIEEWQGERRTRYILNADGTHIFLDSEIVSPRPFIMLMPRGSIKTTAGAENAVQWILKPETQSLNDRN